MAGFWSEVTDNGTKRCALAPVTVTSVIDSVNKNCMGPLDAHHYLPKRNLPDEAKADPRNGVALCRFHHAQVENARNPCPRPPLLDDFLADHGLLESGRPDPKRKAA